MTATAAALALALSVRAYGAEAQLDPLLRAFTRCDAGFFQALKADAAALDGVAPIQANQTIAAIAVPERTADDRNFVRFGKPLTAGAVEMTAYFDEISHGGTSGDFYFWGFFSPMSPQAVAQRLAPSVADAERLVRVDEATYVRLEIHDGKDWRKIASPKAFHGAPGKRVERALIIEPSDNPAFAGTRISCSLQGAITERLLQQERPDLSLVAEK